MSFVYFCCTAWSSITIGSPLTATKAGSAASACATSDSGTTTTYSRAWGRKRRALSRAMAAACKSPEKVRMRTLTHREAGMASSSPLAAASAGAGS